jgi:hypothetical protein
MSTHKKRGQSTRIPGLKLVVIMNLLGLTHFRHSDKPPVN